MVNHLLKQNADQRKEIETLEAASANTANPVQADLVTRLEVADAAAKLLLKQNEYQRKEIATLKATSVNTTNPAQADLVTRLEVADTAVKLLLRQNEYQRKEIATLKATSANTASVNKGVRYRDSNNSHHSRGSPTSSTQEQIPHKFPPLQSQSYWYRRILRNGRNRHDKQDHQTEVDSTVLPQLQNDKIEKINRKYGLKDRRNGDNNHHNHHHNHHHHRRDYKDRNSKDHQKEIVDSAEGSREADNSAGNKS
ncbi:PREDICTED: histone-lysine N-methyltransferase set1-like [Dufourea novaeangliae]|uniref:histone-lysine N-methyltransferase set1-like n=1 Tax=Dufourea novaeangliae TaxID=178035 RepID=UPI00076735C5|nr:PREDICTED: histone-lysine N-methyltransferase set1-like [Dufourea novaeangliae]KZC15207.1 hypothetical protein WN55_00004 [Dufourea novaeangliae]